MSEKAQRIVLVSVVVGMGLWAFSHFGWITEAPPLLAPGTR
jgi:hypothetical protein